MCKKEGALIVKIITSAEHPTGDMRALVTNKKGESVYETLQGKNRASSEGSSMGFSR